MQIFADTFDQLIEKYEDDLADPDLDSFALSGRVYLVEDTDPQWSFRPYVRDLTPAWEGTSAPDRWWVSRWGADRTGRVSWPVGESYTGVLGADDPLPSPEDVRTAYAELVRPLTAAEIEAAHVTAMQANAQEYEYVTGARRDDALAAVRAGVSKSATARAAGITRATLDKWIADAQ